LLVLGIKLVGDWLRDDPDPRVERHILRSGSVKVNVDPGPITKAAASPRTISPAGVQHPP